MRWRLSCHECLSVWVDKEREVLTSQISRTGLFWVSQAKQQFPTHNQLQRLQVLDTESGSYSIHPRAATSAAAIHSRTLQSQVFHRFLLQFLSNTLTFVTKNTFTSLTQHQPCGLTLFSSLFNLIKKNSWDYDCCWKKEFICVFALKKKRYKYDINHFGSLCLFERFTRRHEFLCQTSGGGAMGPAGLYPCGRDIPGGW